MKFLREIIITTICYNLITAGDVDENVNDVILNSNEASLEPTPQPDIAGRDKVENANTIADTIENGNIVACSDELYREYLRKRSQEIEQQALIGFFAIWLYMFIVYSLIFMNVHAATGAFIMIAITVIYPFMMIYYILKSIIKSINNFGKKFVAMTEAGIYIYAHGEESITIHKELYENPMNI